MSAVAASENSAAIAMGTELVKFGAMRAFVAVALVAAAAGTAKVGSRPAAVDARKASLARFGGPASLQPRLEDSDARAGAAAVRKPRGGCSDSCVCGTHQAV